MKSIEVKTIIGKLNIFMANSFIARLKGLLFTKCLEKNECILIFPCKSIHTFGMLYSINIIFLGSNKTVLAVKNNIVPNRICMAPWKTKMVIEMSSEWGSVDSQIIGSKFMEDIE